MCTTNILLMLQRMFFGATPGSAGGVEELTLANPKATWEKADILNVGLDAALFQNHLSFSVEYFNNKYFDQMQQRGRNSTILGNNYPNENIGINRYKGIELMLTYQNNVRDFNYYVTVNASSLKSKVIYQDEVFRQYDWMERTGKPVGLLFGYVADGFFQSQADINNSPQLEGYVAVPGDIKYKDLNGDKIINQFDQAPIGTLKPLIYFGTTLIWREEAALPDILYRWII